MRYDVRFSSYTILASTHVSVVVKSPSLEVEHAEPVLHLVADLPVSALESDPAEYLRDLLVAVIESL